MVLRDFLYLDDRLVTSYLEQLEGGSYEEEQQTTERSGDRSLGGEVGFQSVKAQGARQGASRDELQRTVRQTASSRFARLYDMLGDEVQGLPVLDDSIWDGLRPREVLEVEAELSLPGFARTVGAVDQMEAFMPIMEAFGQSPGTDLQEAVEGIKQLKQMDESRNGHVAIVAATVWSPRYKYVCHLDRECLRVKDLARLEGEASVFGVLQRKVLRGQAISVAGPLTSLIESLPRNQRRNAERALAKDMPKGLGEFSVRYPAAVLNPIAIYR